jgi:hypothetical protein
VIQRRKLNLQLTPLLDLLLIVFFAQYIEIQLLGDNKAQKSVSELVSVKDQLASVSSQTTELKEQLVASKEQIEGQKILLQMQLKELSLKANILQEKDQQLQSSTSQVGQLKDDRRVLVNVLSRMFQVNAEKLEQFLLKADQTGVPPLSPETNQSLNTLIPRLMKMSDTAEEGLIRHVLEYDELRKHCDVWNLFVNDESVIEFEAGELRDAFNALTPEDFSAKLFSVYKKLPETKGTVVLLISYGDNPASIRQAVIKGLPMAAEKMRQDTANRTRFEFAIIGFRPRLFKSPLDQTAKPMTTKQ